MVTGKRRSFSENPSQRPAAAEPDRLLDRLRAGLTQMRYLPRTLGLVWAAARGWTLAWAVLLAVQGVLPVLTVTLTRSLVDSLVVTMATPSDSQLVRTTLLLVVAMGGVMLVSQVMRSITSWVRTAQSEHVQDHILNLIHLKAAQVDFAFYEAPAYYDRMYRAQVQARHAPVTLLENMGGLVQNSITFVAMGAVLVPFGWWLPVALVVSALPAFYVVLRDAVRQHQWRVRATVDERRARYYDMLLTLADSAAELRLFGLGEHFRKAYQVLRRRLRGGRLALAKELSLNSLWAGVVGLLMTGVVMAWMVWRALQGAISLGGLAMLYQAFNQGQGLMRSLLANAGQIYSNSLFLEYLFTFLALEPEVVEPAQPMPVPTLLEEGVRFANITFRYPDSEQEALRDFSLTLPAGRITAVVGANGAGKTTLIKLLCRLYDPQAGRILLDGRDLRAFSLEDLRRQITVLFQEPVHYHATAGQNIALGDLTVMDQARVESAARAVAADDFITDLPQGYDTLLGKRFVTGAELSSGQWQRLALARAFYRQGPIILLDEPTSAMDSWAEADWLARFRAMAVGRTALLITHRFTTAMYADVIHVMGAGQVVESGTHSELVALGGSYARSWTQQIQEAGGGGDGGSVSRD